MTHYAVRDERSGALYPQPHKLIAKKVAEMHGNCVVVPLPEEPVERLALAYLNLLRARVFGDPPRESVDEAKAADQIRADAVILLQAVYGAAPDLGHHPQHEGYRKVVEAVLAESGIPLAQGVYAEKIIAALSKARAFESLGADLADAWDEGRVAAFAEMAPMVSSVVQNISRKTDFGQIVFTDELVRAVSEEAARLIEETNR